MPSGQKTYIAHLDLDCFFVSVERIADPSLNGKPVVVGGDPSGRGVVASASYEARKFGIHSAMPTGRALRLCPHLIVVRGRHGEYGRYSQLLYDYLVTIAPVVERASIDEMNLDFTGCENLYHQDLSAFMKVLQGQIRERFELPCTIALASNKLVAKIAANRVKPNGVITIPHGTEAGFLAPLPVETIPGVGEKTLAQLQKQGICTIAQCQEFSEADLVRRLGSFGSYLHRAARGVGSSVISTERGRKSVSKEETFAKDIADVAHLESELFRMTEKICAECRKNGWKARTVTVKLRYADFSTFTRQQSCPATHADPTVFAIAKHLLHEHYDRSRALRLIGISLSNIVEGTGMNETLFDDSGGTPEILKAVDALRKKFGSDVIHYGGVSN